MNELGSALVAAHETAKQRRQDVVDIDRLAADLGLRVLYEDIAEEDRGRIGFLSDGHTPLKIWMSGRKEDAVYPVYTVVLDRFLLRPEEANRRRFTLAHETAHHLCARHSPAAAFHDEFDGQRTYSPAELRGMFRFEELQADQLAGVLLVPQQKLERVLCRIAGGQPLRLYGSYVLDPATRGIILRAANAMQVSFTTLQIRLKDLDLFERHPMEEYVRQVSAAGGNCP